MTKDDAIHHAKRFLGEQGIEYDTLSLVRCLDERETPTVRNITTPTINGPLNKVWQVNFRRAQRSHTEWFGSEEVEMVSDNNSITIFIDDDTGSCGFLPTL
ncbi:hypothetical protein CA54_47680 [Symmachiella macrocystis]|uniref:Uncharacterized protein n=1 Tax=Symmachiella macrocystis TaxID=2527985 RepID=A0A5C6BE12_9PLAN|nr:hypothetical protein [Symmachiella macrocystis]TWU09526.1 hypothetical protein CA54_47680 [Symmachiella macrocystis]